MSMGLQSRIAHNDLIMNQNCSQAKLQSSKPAAVKQTRTAVKQNQNCSQANQNCSQAMLQHTPRHPRLLRTHVIFSCIGTEHLRHQFIHLFDNISEGDIKGFVLQHNLEVYKFINVAVDLFD
jgi:hypothetical protein